MSKSSFPCLQHSSTALVRNIVINTSPAVIIDRQTEDKKQEYKQ